jgi:hypothetical protein
MNAITSIRSLVEDRANVVHDVGDCVKSWGRRGILWGGLFGFVLSAILVAVPFNSNVLTFGTIGTLLIGAVECAVIAGCFSATVAALNSRGVVRGNSAGSARTFSAGRLLPDANWREGCTPLSTWPDRWAFPGSPAMVDNGERNVMGNSQLKVTEPV